MSNRCRICDKVFCDTRYLAIHNRIHSGERPFSCNVCGKTFTQRPHLRTHFKTHTGELPFTCPICHKGFSDRSNLSRHHRTHTGEKPYSCGVCGKTFNQQSGISSHVKIHTGERPYSCTLCEKSFIMKQHLGVHLKKIHNVKPEDARVNVAMLAKTVSRSSGQNIPNNGKPPETVVVTASVSNKTSLSINIRNDSKEDMLKDIPRDRTAVAAKTLPVNKNRMEENTRVDAVRNTTSNAQSNHNTQLKVNAIQNALSCGVCGKSFVLRSQLVDHVETHN